MNETQLLELGKPGVNYELEELLNTIAKSKKWALTHKGENCGDSDLPNFIEITALLVTVKTASTWLEARNLCQRQG